MRRLAVTRRGAMRSKPRVHVAEGAHSAGVRLVAPVPGLVTTVTVATAIT